jgi:hypothetical protein
MGGATAKSLQQIIDGREYRETTAAASLALMGNLAALFSQLQQSTGAYASQRPWLLVEADG